MTAHLAYLLHLLTPIAQSDEMAMAALHGSLRRAHSSRGGQNDCRNFAAPTILCVSNFEQTQSVDSCRIIRSPIATLPHRRRWLRDRLRSHLEHQHAGESDGPFRKMFQS